MAKRGSDEARLFIDGYDLSGETVELSYVREAPTEETHGLGDSWVEHTAVGVKRGSITQNAFYDDATGKTSAALVGKEGQTRVVVGLLDGNTQGEEAIGYSGAIEMQQARTPSRGALTRISAEYQSSGPIEEGLIVQSLDANSADGVTDDGSLDNGAQSTSGGAAYLIVTDLTLGGYTSVSIDLEQSSDDGSADAFAVKGSFTDVTAAPDAERIELSGTIERYTRVSLTWNGAGSGESITLLVVLMRD